jgi:hypothetical protein
MDDLERAAHFVDDSLEYIKLLTAEELPPKGGEEDGV